MAAGQTWYSSKMFMNILVICLFASVAVTSAQECSSEKCNAENECICFSDKSPLPLEDTPQFVTLTFDDAILETLYKDVLAPVLGDRMNPDQHPISASFFVPHKYTNYEVVNRLYNAGHEIGVHSITKTPTASYWINANVDTLVSEFQGQKTIISHFANVPADDIKGARIPQLQMSGNKNFEAYEKSGISYDSSWTTRAKTNIFPYTLDYESPQECLIGTCPNQTFPGFYIAPIINIIGANEAECNSLWGCETPEETEEIVQWLITQFNRTYNSNKAPQTFMLSAAWFSKNNTMEAFITFLDELSVKNDVYLASYNHVQEWMLNPVPVKEYSIPEKQRNAQCERVSCTLSLLGTETIYMTSCIPCPDVYPWLNNPNGTAPALENSKLYRL